MVTPWRKLRLKPLLLALLVSTLGLSNLQSSVANASPAGISFFEGINQTFYGAGFIGQCFKQVFTSSNQDHHRTVLATAVSGSDLSAADNYSNIVDGKGGFGNTYGYYKVVAGQYYAPTTNAVSWAACNDGALVQKALTAMGYTDGGQFLTTLGYTLGTYHVDAVCSPPTYQNCTPAVDAPAYILSGNPNTQAAIDGKAGTQTSAAKYYAYSVIFAKQCTWSETITGKGEKATLKKVVESPPAGSGKFITQDTPIEFAVTTTQGSTTQSANSADAQIQGYDLNTGAISCRDMLGILNSLAPAMAAFDNLHPDQAFVSADAFATPTAADKAGPVCSGGALGWLLCPVASLMNDINLAMSGVVEGILQTRSMTDPISKVSIQSIWSVLVGAANLLLVIAFLVVIFSQATSLGLTAYGIKKMLPRIIAAAILINLSFWLCGIAIDIINIIGGSIKGIIQVGMTAVQYPAVGSDAANGVVRFDDFGHVMLDITGGLMAAIGVVGVTAGIVLATGSIAFIFPILLGGTAMLVITFLGLALREVMIILLVIVSPLAFVAMILPNTEPYFKKWYQAFFKLLIMYPVIAAIMYGSALVAKIILAGGNI